MRNAGFTLIEVMMSVALLTVVSLGLYYINLAMTKSTLHQEAIATLRDEGRTSLQSMTRMIRNGDSATLVTLSSGNPVALGVNPVSNIHFQAVTDADGNGTALDEDMEVELTPRLGYGLDALDANSDGYSTQQLVRFDNAGNVTRILTNRVATNGLGFVQTAGGVQVTLVLTMPARGIRPAATVRFNQIVDMRN